MDKEMNNLLAEFNKLCILIQAFSDAYNYCVSQGKGVEHLVFLNKFIVKKSVNIRHKLDLLVLDI